MMRVIERRGRYIMVREPLSTYSRYGGGPRMTSTERIRVLHLALPSRSPLYNVSAHHPDILRVVWESEGVPVGGTTIASAKGKALAKAQEEMRKAHMEAP